MQSMKCSKCGLVSFKTEENCKRCNTPLNFSNSSKDKIHRQNNENQVITRTQEVIIGILAVIGGLFLFVTNWTWAMYKEEFHPSMVILAPVCVAFGLCFLLFPYPQKEHFPKAEFAPKTWAILIIPGFIIGGLNYLYFMGML